MSTPQPSPELTTRDVLQQIDHRLSLIETDVRENNTKIEAKIDALGAKTEASRGEIALLSRILTIAKMDVRRQDRRA